MNNFSLFTILSNIYHAKFRDVTFSMISIRFKSSFLFSKWPFGYRSETISSIDQAERFEGAGTIQLIDRETITGILRFKAQKCPGSWIEMNWTWKSLRRGWWYSFAFDQSYPRLLLSPVNIPILFSCPFFDTPLARAKFEHPVIFSCSKRSLFHSPSTFVAWAKYFSAKVTIKNSKMMICKIVKWQKLNLLETRWTR